jgi:TonB family protein
MPAGLRHEVYSPAEIARASGVATRQVSEHIERAGIGTIGGYLRHRDAVGLVRELTGRTAGTDRSRAPITLPRQAPRRGGLPLVASGAVHALFLAALVLITTLYFFGETATDVTIPNPEPLRLVFLMEPGPGGGGGGGGMAEPLPPQPAERKAPAPVIKKLSSPVPPVRRIIPPPPPVETPKVIPPRVDPPAPSVVVAPVVPVPADPVDRPGVLAPAAPATSSAGPGTGGSAGTGTGTGVGEGQGAGIGPGSGGGTGGGPYQPGSGIAPPTLQREVKALYTDEARRRVIEGDVVLEIVVRRDGSVGNVRVLHTLGAGLEQKAIDAVRQWRFGPATRQGVPVDVVVEVSVGFTLR